MKEYIFLNPTSPALISLADHNPQNTPERIKKYSSLITSEHQDKPKFMTWLSATLNIVQDTIDNLNGMPSAFDIDNAVGVQLDVLGQIIGRSRNLPFQPTSESPTMDDTTYRIALKAKILMNQWDGTIPSIYKIWYSLFDDLTLNIIDNQDMTMSALVQGQMDPLVNEMISAGLIVPKPMGVHLNIIEVTNISGTEYVGARVNEMDITTLGG